MDSVVARILGCRCLCGADREKGPLEKSLNTTVRTVYIPQHGNKNRRPDSPRAKPKKVSGAPLLRYEVFLSA